MTRRITAEPDDREYDPAALALFAAYRETRMSHRPLECTTDGLCWVELGPPGLTKDGCRACGGTPRRPVRPR